MGNDPVIRQLKTERNFVYSVLSSTLAIWFFKKQACSLLTMAQSIKNHHFINEINFNCSLFE